MSRSGLTDALLTLGVAFAPGVVCLVLYQSPVALAVCAVWLVAWLLVRKRIVSAPRPPAGPRRGA